VKFFAVKLPVPKGAAGFQQVEGTDDVRGDEIARAGDGTVHVGFRRKVHHVSDAMAFHNLQRRRLVAQIHLLKNVFGMARDFLQIFQPPRIGQAVEVDELLHLHVVDDVLDQIGTDKPRAACDKKIHLENHSGFQFLSACSSASSTPRILTPAASNLDASITQFERGVFAATL